MRMSESIILETLLPLQDDEQKFRRAMVLLPIWEEVRPKPWNHNGKDKCNKCGLYYYAKLKKPDCPIPDAFTGSLGDLAFELRDNAIREGYDKIFIGYWDRAIVNVWEKLHPIILGTLKQAKLMSFNIKLSMANSYFVSTASKNEIIIATLEAIRMAKEGEK